VNKHVDYALFINLKNIINENYIRYSQAIHKRYISRNEFENAEVIKYGFDGYGS